MFSSLKEKYDLCNLTLQVTRKIRSIDSTDVKSKNIVYL